MNRFARTAESSKVIILPVKRPFSNFDFVDRHFNGIASMRRTMSQVRQLDGQTMVIEVIKSAEDIRQEDEDIGVRCPGSKGSRTFRVSFFSKRFQSRCALRKMGAEDFVGYAIVKSNRFQPPIWRTRVYESVVRSSRRENNFVRGEQEWICSVAGNSYPVKGYLYAQQNEITNVCAHVAVRTAAAQYHKDGDMLYREMNKLLGIDHINRTMGAGNGLDVQEMVGLLEAAGARCFQAHYGDIGLDPEKLPFQKCVYGSVESGFPAIVVFDVPSGGGGQHAVPMFGHTFNEDTWVHRADSSYFSVGPKTKYIPSESWVSMYIGHDDNWGSNFCIPRRYLHTRKHCDVGGTKAFCSKDAGCVVHVIGTFPKDILTGPVAAEIIGSKYLREIMMKNMTSGDPDLLTWRRPWRRRLRDYWRLNLLVYRPVLVKGEKYIEHLRNARDWENEKIDVGLLEGETGFETGKWLWLVELSVPELFSGNRRKLGEVLVNAEAPPSAPATFDGFVLARIPGYFVTRDPTNTKFEYWPCGAEGHVELYGCEESD